MVNTDGKRYFKNILHSFANLICTVCNPFEVEFMEYD